MRVWLWIPLLVASSISCVGPEGRDTDGDGLNDARELELGTDPEDPDTDDDGLEDGAEVDAHGTNPFRPDSDEDFLTDGEEVLEHGTDPLDEDTDDGLVPDGAEVEAGTDPLDGSDDATLLDRDKDGLTDAEEGLLGTDLFDEDTDDDRLSDYDEVRVHKTDPLVVDSDGDGLGDGDEVLDHGTSPLSTDTDGGLAEDGAEVKAGTDPLDAADDATILDRDQDGLTDAEENLLGTDLLDDDSDDDGLTDGDEVLIYNTDPLDDDSDDDTLTDGDEVDVFGTDPLDEDTDGGFATDDLELAEGTDPLDPTDDATIIDRDGDGLTDALETQLGTGLLDIDSDDDGLTDGEEFLNHGTDPLLDDTDGDGLHDGAELGTHGTDPLLRDTDDGGVPDGYEINAATDPTDQTDDDPSVLRVLYEGFELGEADPAVWKTQSTAVGYESWWVHRGDHSLELTGTGRATSVELDTSLCTSLFYSFRVKSGPLAPPKGEAISLQYWDGSDWQTAISEDGTGVVDSTFSYHSGVLTTSGALHDALQVRLEHGGTTPDLSSYFVDELNLWCDVDFSDDDSDRVNNTIDCAPSDADHWYDCDSCVDDDGDGFGLGCDLGADCDDSDASVHPAATEVNGDGVDDNCDGFDDATFYYDDFDTGSYDTAVWDTVLDAEESVVGRGYSLELAAQGSALTFALDTSKCSNVVFRARVRLGEPYMVGFKGLVVSWEDSSGVDQTGLAIPASESPNGWQTVDFALSDSSALHTGFRIEVLNDDLLDRGGLYYVDEVGVGCSDGDDDGDGHLFAADCAPDDADHWFDCGYCVDADGDGYGVDCDLGPDCDETDTAIYAGAADSFGDGVDQDCSGFDGPSFFDSFETRLIDASLYNTVGNWYANDDDARTGKQSISRNSGSQSMRPHAMDMSECPEVVWFLYAKREAGMDESDRVTVSALDVSGSYFDTLGQLYGTGEDDADWVQMWGLSTANTRLDGFDLLLGFIGGGVIHVDDFGFACYDAATDDGDGVPEAVDCADDDPAHWSDCGRCTDDDGDDFGDGCDLGADCDDGDATIYPGAFDEYGDAVDADCDGFDGVGMSDDFELGSLDPEVWGTTVHTPFVTTDQASSGSYSLELEYLDEVVTAPLDTTACPQVLWFYDGSRIIPIPERWDMLEVSWWDGTTFVPDGIMRGTDIHDGGSWSTQFGVISNSAAFRTDFQLALGLDYVVGQGFTNSSDAFAIDDFGLACVDMTTDDSDGDGVPSVIDCDTSDGDHWFDCDTCVDKDGDDRGTGCDLGLDCDDGDVSVHEGATDEYGDGVDTNCDGFDGAGLSDDFEAFQFDTSIWEDHGWRMSVSIDEASSGSRSAEFLYSGFGLTTPLDTSDCDEVVWYYNGFRTRHYYAASLDLSWWDGSAMVLADRWNTTNSEDPSFQYRWGRITDSAALRSDFMLQVERTPNPGEGDEIYIDDFGVACGDEGTDGDHVPNPIDCDADSGAHWFDCGVCTDSDGDDYGADCDLGPDCDDSDSGAHPGAAETSGDGIDSDCSGTDGVDQAGSFDSGSLENPLRGTTGEVEFSTTVSQAGGGSVALGGWLASIESTEFNASSCTDGVEFSFYVKRGSTAPTFGDRLYLEYWNGTSWVTARNYLGTGSDDSGFTWTVELIAAADALHSDFRWRFRRPLDGYTSSRWFIDEVYVHCGTDADGDGVSSTVDCDEKDAAHWSDCSTCTDSDGDDYGDGCDLGEDCDDADATVSYAATDTYGDGTDNDCSGYDGPGFLDDFDTNSYASSQWAWVDGPAGIGTQGTTSGSYAAEIAPGAEVHSVTFDTSSCPEIVWFFDASRQSDIYGDLQLEWDVGSGWVDAGGWPAFTYAYGSRSAPELIWGRITDTDAYDTDFRFRLTATALDAQYIIDDLTVACSESDADDDGVPEILDCAPSDGLHWFDCGACTDDDGDGYGSGCDLGADCDDTSATIHPGATDTLDDTIDSDCNTYDEPGIYDGFETSTLDPSRWSERGPITGAVGGKSTQGSRSMQIGAYSSVQTTAMDMSTCSEIVWFMDIQRESNDELVLSYWDGSAFTEFSTVTANNAYDPDFTMWWGTIADTAALHDEFRLEITRDPWAGYGSHYIDELGVTCAGPDVDGDGVPEFLDCDDDDAFHWFDCGLCVDDDGDDFGVDCDLGGDCDDGDTSIYVGAPDTYGDGIDADCSGVDGIGLFDDYDSGAFGGSVDTTSNTVLYNSVSVSGTHSAKLDSGIITHVPVSLFECDTVLWEFQMMRGPTTAPPTYYYFDLEVEERGVWEVVQQYLGTGSTESSFTRYWGEITNTNWIDRERAFRLRGAGKDWAVDDFALSCDDDGDTLTDQTEDVLHGTDPTDPDTDNDGVDDGAEVDAGTDPLNPFSF